MRTVYLVVARTMQEARLWGEELFAKRPGSTVRAGNFRDGIRILEEERHCVEQLYVVGSGDTTAREADQRTAFLEKAAWSAQAFGTDIRTQGDIEMMPPTSIGTPA